jgi:hypothetical protein
MTISADSVDKVDLVVAEARTTAPKASAAKRQRNRDDLTVT